MKPDATTGSAKILRLSDVAEFLDHLRRPVSEVERRVRTDGKSDNALYPYYGANGQAGWIDSYLFDEPLVLLAEDGGAFGSSTKPIAYRVNGRTWVNNHAHVLRPRPGIDVDFLAYALAIRPDVGNMISGTTRAKLNQETAATIPLPVPSYQEQRRIAGLLRNQLAAVGAVHVAASDQFDAAASLRARAYEVAFADSVPFSGTDSVGPPPRGWAWRPLTDLARLETGHTPSRNRPDWWIGDIPWIALPDIRRLDGRLAIATAETTNTDGIANSSARILPTGTVVMSRTASVGFVTRMGRPMATSQDFVNWVCGPHLDPEFLMHLLIRSRDEIRALSSGAIHKTVYFPTVKAFRVAVPAIDEQRHIAAELRERLAVIDAMEASVEAERAAIEALPAALLRRAFEDLAA